MAESPDDLADRKLKARGEVAQVPRETTSADGCIAVLFTARKKTVKPVLWPLVIADFEPKMCDAIHNPGNGDGMMSPKTQGFAAAGKRVLAESIKFAQPIYQAIGADWIEPERRASAFKRP